MLLVWHNHLSNIEITKYYNYEPWYNVVFSRDNLRRIKDEIYVINLNDNKKEHIGFHFLLMEILCTLDFDSSEIQYIDQDIINKIKDKSITYNIFR